MLIARIASISAVILFLIVVIGCTNSGSSNLTAVNVDRDGNAIKGYDPIAYFTEGRPVKGDARFAFTWNNAQWLFSSEDHLSLFKKDPEKYVPQYGGY
jgi:YHS domain-containing protein